MPEDGNTISQESETQNTEGQSPTELPSGVPTETTPSEPRTLKGAGLRYGSEDEVPEWAKGKTADEVLELANEVFRTLPTTAPQQQVPQEPVQQPQQATYQPHPQVAQVGPPSLDLAYSDQEEYNRQLVAWQQASTQQQVQQAGQQVLRPVYQNMAVMARNEVARNSEYKAVFQKYGHEVDQEMSNVPFEQRNVQAYEWLAQKVLGKHAKELLGEEIRNEIRSSGGPDTASASQVVGTEPATYNSALDEFWASDDAYVRNARAEGLSKEQIRENIGLMGLDEESYIKAIKSGNVVYGKTGVLRKEMTVDR